MKTYAVRNRGFEYSLIIVIIILIGFMVASFDSQERKERLKYDKAKQLVTASGLEKVVELSMNQVLSSVNSITPEQMVNLRKEMNLDRVRPILIDTYLKFYTVDELDDLLAFYSTPTGKKVASIEFEKESYLDREVRDWSYDAIAKAQRRSRGY